MEINDLIRIVNDGYPEGVLVKYWDFKSQNPKKYDPYGDGIAQCILQQLYNSYAPYLCGGDQILEAQNTIETIIDELMDIKDKLDNELCRLNEIGEYENRKRNKKAN